MRRAPWISALRAARSDARRCVHGMVRSESERSTFAGSMGRAGFKVTISGSGHSMPCSRFMQ